VLRQLRSVYSFINLTGLIVGFTVFILIYFWVEHELSYDRFHHEHSIIFRVVENQVSENGLNYPVAVTPAPLAPYLKNTFPEVNEVCRLNNLNLVLRLEEKAFYQAGIVADPSLFRMFSFPTRLGETKSFESGVDKIVITEKLAKVYFGEANPVGKVLQMLDRDMLIVAVVENIPANSHLQFDFVIPFEFLKDKGYDDLTNWKSNQYHTYVKVEPQTDVGFGEKIRDAIVKNEPVIETEIALQSLTDIHLRSNLLNNDIQGHGNMQYIYISSALAIFILIVASINYANLATARSIKRSKEVGIRKVIGANRLQLVMHFFSESFLYCTLAFAVAVLLSWLLLPQVSDLSGKALEFKIFSKQILFPLLASVFFCAVLAGIYPALLLSSLNPVAVLKGNLKVGRSTIIFRRILVALQFVITISFLSGTFVVQNQLNFIRKRNLGFEKENILTFSTTRKIRSQYQTFKNELLALNGVKNVTATSTQLSLSDESTDNVYWEGKNPDTDLLFHLLKVDFDFVKTLSIQLAAGRDFSDQIASDSMAVLLNEEAIRQMRLTNPINKQFKIGARAGTIIGIVKDFNFKSAHKKIEPIVIYIEPESFYETAILLDKGNLNDQVKSVETVFKKFTPGSPFEYSFLDEDINMSYQNEERTGKIFNYLAGISVFISCLGLLGIVMFVTEQRAKEVAVRKVLGASVIQLMYMLTIEFIVLVTIAFVIATPITWYITSFWLKDFAYHVNPSVFVFALAGLISLTITWLTIGYKSFQVSRTSPVDSLRND